MKIKKITPLSKFPTEAILYLYRKNRHCYTQYTGLCRRWKSKTNEYIFWKAGPSEPWLHIDGNIYNIPLYYERVDHVNPKDYTEITGNHWHLSDYNDRGYYTEEIDFEFEGMYWKGTIQDIHDELSKRPNVNIIGTKSFRKWKINYKKSLKNHK